MSTTLSTNALTVLVYFFPARGDQTSYDYLSWEKAKGHSKYNIVIPLPEISDERRRRVSEPVHKAYFALKQVALLEGVGSEAFEEAWHHVQRELKKEMSAILCIDLHVCDVLAAILRESAGP